jgi:hypothetical protein
MVESASGSHRARRRRERAPFGLAESRSPGDPRVWAKREGASLIVVFDGDPPEGETENVAGSGARSADDRIVELSLSTERPLWLVTSDRELRERVSPPPERVIGGGGFLRLLDRE